MSNYLAPKIMLSRFKLKEYTSSLFFRMLIGFLVVISLPISFILYSVGYYKESMKEEVIRHNTLNLQKTVEKYDRFFDSIYSSFLSFSLELQDMQGKSVNYSNAVATMYKIQQLVSNRTLFLENVILLNKASGFALEKSRGSDMETMFERYYNSPDYSVSFWKEQFQQSYKSRLLPVSRFAEQDAGGRTDEKTLLPIVIKNEWIPDFFLLAMADADPIYAELGLNPNDRFYILNEQDQLIYASSKQARLSLPKFPGISGYLMIDGVYYFYKKSTNGLTYAHLLPDTTIARQIRWNFWFLLLLVLMIAVSVIVSLLVSVRLNSPVRRIVNSIQKSNTLPVAWESSIKEFNIITHKINDILQESRDMHQDMSRKESLLKYYAYSNALKKIRHEGGNHTSWIPENRPFVLLLFQVTYKTKLTQLNVEEERATSFLREYVNRIIAQTYTDSLTFQMEQDRILSIVFSEINDPKITSLLGQIRRLLEAEQEYCFLTITASGGTEDWNEAYMTGLKRLGRRTFGDDTQIVANSGTPDEELGLSQAQEEELDTNLYEGNDTVVLQLVRRVLGKMRKRGQNAGSVLLFAESVVLRTQKNLLQRQIDPEPARKALEDLHGCYTYEQLDEALTVMIKTASRLVKESKEKRDPIIAFIYDYMDQHYEKDITLDALADKLKLSRSYLSKYFKEKTGDYFVDYVNSVRISRAKTLLLNPDIRIQDAAQLVGYQNINSFNRMFKKFTGLTPSEYRKHTLTT